MAFDAIERWIQLFERRTRWGAFLRVAAEALALFLCFFGALVLGVKLLAPSLWPHVAWTACAAVPLAGWAWWASRGDRWSRRDVIARLDRELGTGGLLMTLSERSPHGATTNPASPTDDSEQWASRLPADKARWGSAIPRLWPERFLKVVTGPAVFALATLFIPLRELPQVQATPNAVARQATSQLAELLKEVEERPVLEEEEKQQLVDELGKLVEETESKPLTHETWEVVDALRERLRVRLEQAEALSQLAQQTAAALDSGENANGKPLTKEERDQLEQQLEETLQKLGDKQPASTGTQGASKSGSSDILKRLMKRGNGKPKLSSDPTERKKELDELKDFLKKECDKLGKCRGKCQGQCSGNCDKEGECEGQCQGNRPGRGGTTRGRADAELTWGDESDLNGTKFKETILPPGFNELPKDEVVRVDLTAPQIEDTAASAKTAGREQGPASGRATWNRSLSPRHRDVVRKYFETK